MTSNFSTHSSFLGIFSMFVGILVYSLLNLLIKDLSFNFSILQITLFRTGFAIIPAFIMLMKNEPAPKYKTPDLKRLAGLGLVNMLSVWLIFKSFALLHVSQAQTLCFTSILFVTMLSPIFLKEHLTFIRIFAVILGFLGVLFVAQPSGEDIHPWGIVTAILFALSDAVVLMNLRAIGGRNSSYKSAFYLMGFATCWALFFYAIHGFFSDDLNNILSIAWSLPDPKSLAFLIVLGLGGGLGQILVANAFRLADATLVSPVIYMGVVWGVLFDWSFFGNSPTLMLNLGALFVIMSGLIIVFEQQIKSTVLHGCGSCSR